MQDREIIARDDAIRNEIRQLSVRAKQSQRQDDSDLRQALEAIDQRFEAYKTAAQSEIARLDARIDNVRNQATAAIQAIDARVTALEQASPPPP